MEHKNDLGRLICHASVLIRRDLDRAVAQATGDPTLSGRNIWVLRYLSDHREEPVFQKNLEGAFRIRRSTVSCTVELMEQKQLLVRESVNGDARKKRLRLTPKADAVLEEMAKAVDALERDVRAIFSPQDYDTIMRLLRHLCVFLDTPDGSNEA